MVGRDRGRRPTPDAASTYLNPCPHSPGSYAGIHAPVGHPMLSSKGKKLARGAGSSVPISSATQEPPGTSAPVEEFTMIKRTLPLLIGLSVCGAVAAQTAPATSQSTTGTTPTTLPVTTWTAKLPSGALSEEAIKTSIANAGFKEVKGLKFKDGVWRS